MILWSRPRILKRTLDYMAELGCLLPAKAKSDTFCLPFIGFYRRFHVLRSGRRTDACWSGKIELLPVPKTWRPVHDSCWQIIEGLLALEFYFFKALVFWERVMVLGFWIIQGWAVDLLRCCNRELYRHFYLVMALVTMRYCYKPQVN